MITAQIYLWASSLTVLVEETTGQWRRLTGEPFGDDSSMPLVVSVLGKEAYVGTAAITVAYESARASARYLAGETDSASRAQTLAALLAGVASSVRRRYLQDDIRWVVVIDCADPLGETALACWRAGIPDAQICDNATSLVSRSGASARPGTARLLSLVKAGHPTVQLAVATDDGWNIVDEHVSPDPLPDPYRFPGSLYVASEHTPPSPLPVQFLRSLWSLDNAIRATLSDQTTKSCAFVILEGGAWRLKPTAASNVLAQESAYWERLAGVCAEYRSGLGDCRIDRVVVCESGQRAFARRFEHGAQQRFARALALPIEHRSIEEGIGTVQAPVLDADYALSLGGQDGPLGDHKMIATRGTSLPYTSEHLMYLQRSVQKTVSVQISRRDGLTDQHYPFAAADVELYTDMKRNTAVKLGVAFRRCGLAEISISVPDYQFSTEMLAAPNGTVIPDSGSPHGESVARLFG
jgi:hypothetical protein